MPCARPGALVLFVSAWGTLSEGDDAYSEEPLSQHFSTARYSELVEDDDFRSLSLLQVSVRATHGRSTPFSGAAALPAPAPITTIGRDAGSRRSFKASGWAVPRELAGEVGHLTYGVGARAKRSLALEGESAAHIFPQRHVAVWHGHAGDADWATKMASTARDAALGALAEAGTSSLGEKGLHPELRLAMTGGSRYHIYLLLLLVSLATLWSAKVALKGHQPIWNTIPASSQWRSASAQLEAKLASSPSINWAQSLFAQRGTTVHKDDRKLSVWDGTVLTFTAITGTGLLAMPYAFSLAGMVAAPILIFFVCCSGYTVHLMVWSFNTAAARKGGCSQLTGWGSLMGLAFGDKAKMATDVFLIVEVWGYMLSFVVATVLNLGQIAEGLSTGTAIAISVAAAYSLTFVPRHVLTRMNVLSNVVYGVCCLMFIITGFLLPSKAPSSEVVFVRPQGLLSAAGILVFGPASHSFFPAVMQQMEEPAAYPKCVRRAYGAALVFYLTMAIPGYFLFGKAVQPSAVHNIGLDRSLQPLPGLGWMHPVAAIGMVAKMMSLQPIALTSLCGTVEGMLRSHFSEEVLRFAVPPAILATAALAAFHFANEMGELINLIGSIFCMTIAFVVPVLCYWKLSPVALSPLTQAILVGLVAMGGTLALIGALSAL